MEYTHLKRNKCLTFVRRYAIWELSDADFVCVFCVVKRCKLILRENRRRSNLPSDIFEFSVSVEIRTRARRGGSLKESRPSSEISIYRY